MNNKVRTTLLLEKDEALALTLLAQEMQPLGPNFTMAVRKVAHDSRDIQRLLPLATKLVNDNPTLRVRDISDNYRRSNSTRPTGSDGYTAQDHKEG